MKLWPFSKKDKAGGASSASSLPPGVVLAAPEEAEQDPLGAPNVASHNDPVLSDPAPASETPPPLPKLDASEVYLFGDPTETAPGLPQGEAGPPEALSMDSLPPQANSFPSAEALMPPLTPEPQPLGIANTPESMTPAAATALPEWMSDMTSGSADNAQGLANTLDLLTPPAAEQVNMSGFTAAWGDAEPLGDAEALNRVDSSEMPPMDFFATNPEYIMPTEAVSLPSSTESITPLGSSALPMEEAANLEADPMSWLDNPAERGGHTQAEMAVNSDLLADLAPPAFEQPVEPLAAFEATDISLEMPAGFSSYETAEDTSTIAEADFNNGFYELSAEPTASAGSRDLYGLGSLTDPMPISSELSLDAAKAIQNEAALYSAPLPAVTDSTPAEEVSLWSEPPLPATNAPFVESATFEILPEPDEDTSESPMQAFDTFRSEPEAAPDTAMDPPTAMCFDTDHSLEAMAPLSLDEPQAFAGKFEDDVLTLDSPAEDDSFLFSPEFDPQNESLLADLPSGSEEEAEEEEEMFYSQEDLDLADPPADLDSYDLGHYDDPNDLHNVINLDEATPSAEVHVLSEQDHDSAAALEEVQPAEEDPLYNFYDPAPEAAAIAEPTLSSVDVGESMAFTSPGDAPWDLEPPEVPSAHNEPAFVELTAMQEAEAPLPQASTDSTVFAEAMSSAGMDILQQSVEATEEASAPAAEPARIIPLQPLLPEATPPARQTAYPQSTFDFKPKATQQRSMVEALDDFEQQILLEDSRFLKKSIDDLVSRYFAQKDREEKAW